MKTLNFVMTILDKLKLYEISIIIYRCLYHHGLLKTTLKKLKHQGVNSFSFNCFREVKSSDTLFILGSGSSINKLSEEHWKEIASADSIGLNFWLLHDFVPTFYQFEAPRGERKSFFENKIRQNSDRYRDVKFIYKGTDRDLIDHANIPDEILMNMYLSKKIPIPCENVTRLNRSLKFLAFLRFWRLTEGLLHARASLSTAVYFGLVMGYKKVVLLGVDLNTIEYFWQENVSKDGAASFDTGQQGAVHKTLEKKDKSLSIDKIIYSINENMLTSNGVKLYTGFKSSALWPEIDSYFE